VESLLDLREIDGNKEGEASLNGSVVGLIDRQVILTEENTHTIPKVLRDL
jgi:hypothetical protein